MLRDRKNKSCSFPRLRLRWVAPAVVLPLPPHVVRGRFDLADVGACLGALAPPSGGDLLIEAVPMMGGRDHQGPNKDRALSLGYGRVGLSPPDGGT